MDTNVLMNLMGMGTANTPVVGAGLGLVQLLSGLSQQKKANSLYPQVPPIYNQLIQEYRRKSRNAEVGNMFNSVTDRARNIASNAAKATLMTGNPMAYNLAMKNVSQMMNELLAGVQNKSDAYSNVANTFANKLGDLQYANDSARYNQAMNTAMNNKQSGLNNLLMATTYGFMGNNATPKTTSNIETPSPPYYPDLSGLIANAPNVQTSGIPFANFTPGSSISKQNPISNYLPNSPKY